MPVFNVEVELRTIMVVEAEDEDHAWEVALEDHREAFSDASPKPHIHVMREAKSVSQLAEKWDGMCIPYGGDGNTRLRDLLPS